VMKETFYQSIMIESPAGYAYHKILCDDSGHPYDYEFIEINPAFELLTGLRDVPGKRISELLPNIGEKERNWIKSCGEIAIYGGSKFFEEYSPTLKRWYKIKVYSPEKYYFITYFIDITKETIKETEELLRKSEEQYRLLFENAVETILVVQNEHVKICNPMAEILSGYPMDEILTTPFLHFVHPEDRQQILFNYRLRLNGEPVPSINTFKLIRKDQSVRWVEMNSIKIDWEGEVASLNFLVDITDRKRVEDALKTSEEKYRLLTENASDVIWVFNVSTEKFTYISPSVYSLRGITAEEAMGETLEKSMTPNSLLVIQEAIARNKEGFIRDPETQKYSIHEIQQPSKKGGVIWVEVSMKFRYNPEGEIEVVGVSRNIEERKKSEREVIYLSYHDQLTGLYNRRFYEEELKRLDTERNLPMTLVLADVNGLKLTNDAFGHLEGDRLLQDFAEILKSNSRADDIIARIGGDEFIILLPQTDSVHAEKIVNRIQASLYSKKSEKVVLSVSFGWASKMKPEEDFNKVFVQAEDFMYRKKLLESSSMKSKTIQLITKSLYEKHAAEQGHCERVSKLCRDMGMVLGLHTDAVDELSLLGLFHDIGKIGISERILNKSEKLSNLEWAEMKRHPEIGYQILRSTNEFVPISEYVLSHHERLDGNGYPRKLKEGQIPLQTRILTIAESYDTMTSTHPYKPKLSDREAIKELRANVNRQFDPEIARIFVEKILKRKWHTI